PSARAVSPSHWSALSLPSAVRRRWYSGRTRLSAWSSDSRCSPTCRIRAASSSALIPPSACSASIRPIHSRSGIRSAAIAIGEAGRVGRAEELADVGRDIGLAEGGADALVEHVADDGANDVADDAAKGAGDGGADHFSGGLNDVTDQGHGNSPVAGWCCGM